MKQQTEAPFSDREDNTQDDTESVSKSQIKRDSKSLQILGKKLSALNAEQIATVPLNDKLLDAIELAHKLSNKRGALKRHYQYIGKLLRCIDAEPVLQAVQTIEQADSYNKQTFKQTEYWRDRILQQGDEAIDECCQQHPNMQRQEIRQIWRNHHLAPSDEKKIRFARQLFKKIAAAI